jgi:type IV pilus assembly protein PilQ
MKAHRSLLALFLLTAVGLVAQDAPAPAPAPAAATDAPAPAPAPAETPPANPLAPVPTAPAPAPTAPALNIAMPDSAAASSAPAATSTPAASASGSLPSGTMDVANFPNEEIRTILLNVAKLFNLNIVVPDTLTGTTSIQLHDVTWQQIYQVVLDPIGYTFQVNGSGPNALIMIKNKTDIAAEPMTTRVIAINSAKAEDLAKSLQAFLDTGSKPPESIVPEPRTNSLIITAHPAKFNNLVEALNLLDKQTAQVAIETKFLEVNANNDDNLGIQWNFNGTPLISAAYAYQYEAFDKLNAIYNSGAVPSSKLPIQSGANVVNAPIAQPNSIVATPPRRAADLAVFNQAQYSAVLTALQNVTNAKLVSNPTAVTLDNMETNIFSGTNITVVFPTINNQTGQTQAGSNQVYQIGITMKVKPHVTNGGFINLTLNPELSRLDPQSDTYFGASYPRVDTRRLTDANVSIKDGYTLAIGGLIDDQDSKSTIQVPILGDLPVIGRLFQSTDTIKTRNNLLIFITARTLNPDGATYNDIISPELMLRSGATAPDLPGYYNAKSGSVTPGMTYAPNGTLNAMDQVQKDRDQAAQMQQFLQYQAQVQAAQKNQPKAAASSQGKH